MNLYNEIMLGIGIGLGVGGSISYYLVSGWMEDYAAKEQNYKLEMLASLKQTRKMLIDKVVEDTHAANALIIKVSNGGGKLEDGKPWYSSVVSEAPESRDCSMISDWQNKPLEDSEKSALKKLMTSKVSSTLTEDMPHGKLRTTYEALGFIADMKLELYSDDYYYYYMLFIVRDNWDKFTLPDDQYLIEKTLFNLSNKYQVYSKLNILKYDKLH